MTAEKLARIIIVILAQIMAVVIVVVFYSIIDYFFDFNALEIFTIKENDCG